jgi:Ribbon-helix-helix protein, copG family
MLATVRLDVETEQVLARLARSSGRTRSDVIRAAILELARQSPSPANDKSLFASIADLIGVAHGGPPDLSVRTGDKLRSLLAARARGRRR